MTKTIPSEESQNEKLSIGDYAMEAAGWLQIVASPLLLGIVIGGVTYLSVENNTGLVAGILIAFLGLIIGVVMANRVWRKKGTIFFMSRVNASPELDDSNSRQKEKVE